MPIGKPPAKPAVSDADVPGRCSGGDGAVYDDCPTINDAVRDFDGIPGNGVVEKVAGINAEIRRVVAQGVNAGAGQLQNARGIPADGLIKRRHPVRHPAVSAAPVVDVLNEGGDFELIGHGGLVADNEDRGFKAGNSSKRDGQGLAVGRFLFPGIGRPKRNVVMEQRNT